MDTMAVLLYSDILEVKASFARSIIADDMTVAYELVLVGHKSVRSHRASCVYLACAYADFRAETITETVRKSC